MDNYEISGQMDIFDFLPKEITEKPNGISINKDLLLIELFAGYGSQALALKELGVKFKHHFVCEFDKYACKSYSAVHGVDVQPIDIRDVKGGDLNITNTDKYMYMLTYSFP